MRSKVTTAPTTEPVTLDDVKTSLRITHSSEDALLTQYIEDARIYAENYTGRKFITQTITSYHDDIAGRADFNWEGTQVGSYQAIAGDKLFELEYGPVQSITSMDLVDADNNEDTYASSNYYLDNYDDDLRGRLILNRGSTITGDLRSTNPIKIVYVAGYGAASDVPSLIQRALIELAGGIYRHRGDCNDGVAKECGAMAKLEQYRYQNA